MKKVFPCLDGKMPFVEIGLIYSKKRHFKLASFKFELYSPD